MNYAAAKITNAAETPLIVSTRVILTWRLRLLHLMLLPFLWSAAGASADILVLARPYYGVLEEYCGERVGVLSCRFVVNLTDSAGNFLPYPGFPKAGITRGGTWLSFGVIPAVASDVRQLTDVGINLKLPVFTGGAQLVDAEPPEVLLQQADLSIESVFFDTTQNKFLLENIFGRIAAELGVGVTVQVPDLFADTNGNGTIGSGDILYSLVDLAVYLQALPSFAPGDSFSIVGGLVEGLPGMMFSTTPFSFNADTGFDTGTPFTGTGQTESVHQLQALPEPPLLALLALGCFGLAALRRSSCRLGVNQRKNRGQTTFI